ncbi:ribbon-helix-helix domain-containing protein [Patescibacteria group bacterium AH-259-L05]|nr:ribbon-helix-helix domain-containing protein [Patescibacteria group bacterium AH-259-L05]
MSNTHTKTYKRVNVTLPTETLRMIERLTKKGNRSRFIDTAVRFYADKVSRMNLRKLLKERALTRSEEDLQIAKEWFHIDNEL